MSPKKWLALLIVLALIAGGGVLAYQYNEAKKEAKAAKAEAEKLKDPEVAARAQNEKLIADVSKLTQLPQGETPTIATVSDITKLKDQPFFDNAQNGDRVLIYTGAKKAYLYRPSTNKIINIAPVNIGDSKGNAAGDTSGSGNE